MQITDLDEVYQRRLQARDNVKAQLSAQTLQQAMRRCLPYPCSQRYTAVAMLPRDTIVNKVLSSLGSAAPTNPRTAGYWVLAAAIGTAGALAAARYMKRS